MCPFKENKNVWLKKEENRVRKSELHLQQRQRIDKEGPFSPRTHCEGCAGGATAPLSSSSTGGSLLGGKKKKVRWVVHRSAQIDGKDTWLSVNDMFTSPLASSLFSAAEKLNFASKS